MALGILEQRADDRQRPYVDDLREEIQHMSGLVNELLSFSKASLRGQSLELRAVPLAEVVRKVVAREGESGQIETQVAENLAVLAEPELLGRALGNLIRNAIRYAGAAGPIKIEARRAGDEITVLVTDSGPGLPAEALEHLFEPFYRADAARTRETGGAGLGLAIVKSCLDACQARINCRNLAKGFQAEIVLRATSQPDATGPAKTVV
jgi:two-component system, OmpR family, sensor histidine kinase CpxA